VTGWWRPPPLAATGGRAASVKRATDVNAAAAERAKKIGATAAYSYSGDQRDPAKLVNEEIVKTYGKVDAVFNTTGNPDVLSAVLPAVRPQGNASGRSNGQGERDVAPCLRPRRGQETHDTGRVDACVAEIRGRIQAPVGRLYKP